MSDLSAAIARVRAYIAGESSVILPGDIPAVCAAAERAAGQPVAWLCADDERELANGSCVVYAVKQESALGRTIVQRPLYERPPASCPHPLFSGAPCCDGDETDIRCDQCGAPREDAQDAYRRTVADLQEVARKCPRVTQEWLLQVASMDAADMRRRLIRSYDWMGHYVHALDGIPEIQALPGAGIDGCRSDREVRAIVDGLLRQGGLQAREIAALTKQRDGAHADFERATQLLDKARREIATWEQVWNGIRERVHDLREDNKPLAVAAAYELLARATEQAEAAERDAATRRAINRAAAELPEGYEVIIGVENGAAYVTLHHPDGRQDESIDVDADDRLTAEIGAAIARAHGAEDAAREMES